MDTEIIDTEEQTPIVNDFSERKFCRKCGVEIPGPSPNYKKFCSKKCAVSFHALKRYHKIKSTEKYKKNRNNYRLKTKEKVNS